MHSLYRHAECAKALAKRASTQAHTNYIHVIVPSLAASVMEGTACDEVLMQ